MIPELMAFGAANLAAGFTAAWLCDRTGWRSPPITNTAGEVPSSPAESGRAAPSSTPGSPTVWTGAVHETLCEWGLPAPPRSLSQLIALLIASDQARLAWTELDSQLRAGDESRISSAMEHARLTVERWQQIAAAAAEEARSSSTLDAFGPLVRCLVPDQCDELRNLLSLVRGEQRAFDARLVSDPRLESAARLLDLTYRTRDVLQRVLAERGDELSPDERQALETSGPASQAEWLRLVEQLTAPLAPGQSRYLIKLELDRFRRLNQQLGATLGDALIRGCQVVLSGALAERHHVSGLLQLGGPEFAMLVDAPAEQAMEMAELLRQSVEASSFQSGQQAWELTVSVGVAPVGTCPLSELEAIVTQALCEARSAGRNRTCIADPSPTIVQPSPLPVTRQIVQLLNCSPH